MADYNNEFSTDANQGDNSGQDQQQNQNSGGGLRKQLEETLAQLKQERESRQKLEQQVTQSTINGIFAELEVPEKVRKFYSGEPDKDKILEWIKEHADIFGLTVPGSEQADNPEDRERNAQFRDVQQANTVGFEAGGSRAFENAVSDINTGIRDKKLTEADLDSRIMALFNR